MTHPAIRRQPSPDSPRAAPRRRARRLCHNPAGRRTGKTPPRRLPRPSMADYGSSAPLPPRPPQHQWSARRNRAVAALFGIAGMLAVHFSALSLDDLHGGLSSGLTHLAPTDKVAGSHAEGEFFKSCIDPCRDTYAEIMDDKKSCLQCKEDAEDLKKNAKCITIRGHTDGIGSQYLAVLSGIVAAQRLGLPFVHTLPTRIAHMPPTEDSQAAFDKNKIRDVDLFFGLHSSDKADECAARDHFLMSGFESLASVYQNNALISLEFAEKAREIYFGGRSAASKAVFDPKDFGADYVAKRDRNVHDGIPFTCTANSGCDVVVHIRRGDIHKLKPKRYVTDKMFLWLFDRVKADILGKKIDAALPDASLSDGELDQSTNCMNQNKRSTCEPVVAGDSVDKMRSTKLRFHIYSVWSMS
eukprot:SAG31_NODE_1484_length_8160_cov_5.766778_1_plen_413_part_00